MFCVCHLLPLSPGHFIFVYYQPMSHRRLSAFSSPKGSLHYPRFAIRDHLPNVSNKSDNGSLASFARHSAIRTGLAKGKRRIITFHFVTVSPLTHTHTNGATRDEKWLVFFFLGRKRKEKHSLGYKTILKVVRDRA